MDRIEEVEEYISELAIDIPSYGIPLETGFTNNFTMKNIDNHRMLLNSVHELNSYYEYKQEIDQFAYKGETYQAAPPSFELYAQNEAYVDNSSLVTFAGDMDSNLKDDMLNSMLFAQFAAGAASKPDDLLAWHNKYWEVLQHLGCVVQNNNFSTYVTKGTTLEVEKVVLEILGTLALPSNATKIIIAALNVMKQLPAKDRRIMLFNTASRTQSVGSFQIANCYTTNSGSNTNIEIGLACVHFTTTQKIQYVLGFKSQSSHASLKYNTQKLAFNYNLFNKTRDLVRDRIGKISVNYIDKIPLALPLK
jgi:hypothetical protein